MPQLLELTGDAPLHSRFSFLNVVDKDPIAAAQSSSGRTQLSGSALGQNLSEPAVLANANLIPATDLVPLFVVKTNIIGVSKLFINVAGLKSGASRLSQSPHGIWCSEVTTDVDKAGKTCRVLTALINEASMPEDQAAERLISAIRAGLQLDVGVEHSLPKMRKKGNLSDVSLLSHKKELNTRSSGSTGVKKSLITEIHEPIVKAEPKSATKTQHKVESLTRAILSMPLPTMYTHRVTFKMHAELQNGTRSWSVYFDSQDLTLKILLPPDEEFITLAVKTDDFRAFSRAGQLYIFYVG